MSLSLPTEKRKILDIQKDKQNETNRKRQTDRETDNKALPSLIVPTVGDKFETDRQTKTEGHRIRDGE